ncbi:MAG: rod shape-determining protein MreC [Phycisphaeraceae bacterium]|jgi:cell shape-determining protein MreC
MLSQRKALVLVTLVLFGCALLNKRWSAWLTGPITHTVNTLQYPADLLASSMKAEVQEELPEVGEEKLRDLLNSALKENAELWTENQKLNEQLESFKVIYERVDPKAVQLVEARVSRLNDDPINPTMLVLRGTLHGLKPDDPVAFKSNLIGFVTDSIGPANATVTLITREGFSIGVQIMPPPEVEAGEGWPFVTRVKSDGEGAFYFELKESIARKLQPGDYVRASDTIRDSANGFLLGLIEKIEPAKENPLNLSRVTVRPRVPIGPQRMVTILTERTD